MADAATDVQSLYVAYFGRPADTGGLAYWSGILAQQSDGYQAIADAFSNAAEYRAMVAGMDSRAVVGAVYEHLFGRPAEAAGVAYWAELLERREIGIADVVTRVAAGAQGNDKAVFDAKVAVASAFTAHLDLEAEKVAYSGPVANKVGADYLAAITDAASAAFALDPEHIDAAIKEFTPVRATGMAETSSLVGVPTPIELAPFA